jgi:hypothetical protein
MVEELGHGGGGNPFTVSAEPEQRRAGGETALDIGGRAKTAAPPARATRGANSAS